MNAPMIIPVAGGKGGIGKSLIAANMALLLARMGHRVVAVDLDLGASNLHVLFGLRNSIKNILHFACSADATLDEMILDSGYDNLGIICGAANIAGASNINSREKMRILHSIGMLSCDYVILDLGAGSSFNVTDFFLTGKGGIVVLAPEITSLLDAYSLLKSTLHRKLQMEWQSTPEIAALVDEFRDPEKDTALSTVKQLIDATALISQTEAHRMRRMVDDFEVKVVLNKVEDNRDFRVLKTLQDLAWKNLNLRVVNLGFVPHATSIARSVNKMIPFVKTDPSGFATTQMTLITRNLVERHALAV